MELNARFNVQIQGGKLFSSSQKKSEAAGVAEAGLCREGPGFI